MPLFEALRRKRAKMARVIPRNICLGLSDIEMHLLKILEFRSVAQKICLKDTLTTDTGRNKGVDCSISLRKIYSSLRGKPPTSFSRHSLERAFARTDRFSPVLNLEVLYPAKLSRVVGNQRESEAAGMGRDE
jgi:hypothetical protein